LKRIIELCEIVKKTDAAKISIYNNTPDWLTFKEDNEPWNGNTECEMMVVWQDSVNWDAMIKHVPVQIETQTIYMKEIKEMYETLTTPQKKLPLLIGNLKSKEAKEILEKRLKDG